MRNYATQEKPRGDLLPNDCQGDGRGASSAVEPGRQANSAEPMIIDKANNAGKGIEFNRLCNISVGLQLIALLNVDYKIV